MERPTILDRVTKKDLQDPKLIDLYTRLSKNEIYYWYNRSEATTKQSACFLVLERLHGGREGILRRMFHYADSLRCEEEADALWTGGDIPLLADYVYDGVRQREMRMKELVKRQKRRSESEREWILSNYVKVPVLHKAKQLV